jgi:hypothetical protein
MDAAERMKQMIQKSKFLGGDMQLSLGERS